MFKSSSLITSYNSIVVFTSKHKPVIVAFVYLILISMAEIIAALYNPVPGIIIHIIILFALILHATLNIHEPIGKMLLSLALAPMIRIASYSVPLVALRPFATYILIYFPLAISSFIVCRSLHLKQSEVGLAVKLPAIQLAIGLTGFIFGVMEYMVLHYPPMVSRLALSEILLPAFVLTMTTGFVEEYVFR
ncbi:MAG: hypothetical protein Q8P44_07645, partial [Dehalococcoidia bacterium]|nr:hypothetical protein [Dehalococcoidia bacterium]